MQYICVTYECWEQKYDMYFILLREEIRMFSSLLMCGFGHWSKMR